MKRKNLHPLFVIALIIWAACASNEDKKATPPDDMAATDDSMAEEMVDSTFSAETVDTFSTLGFSSYAKKQTAGFDWTRFRLVHTWVEDSMVTAPFTPTREFMEAYGRFLKYSPDSSMFIDLDSYNVEIRKDSKGRWRGAEMGPDTEVSLVNRKTGNKTRLLFLGPGNSVEDAMWLDQNNLAIMGIEDHGDSTGKVAAVWTYNVPSRTFSLYELADSAAARQLTGYWRKERLKGIVMEDGD